MFALLSALSMDFSNDSGHVSFYLFTLNFIFSYLFSLLKISTTIKGLEGVGRWGEELMPPPPKKKLKQTLKLISIMHHNVFNNRYFAWHVPGCLNIWLTN
jgi:hypothetical protein